ncbi:MAG: glycosyltransferase family 2 protein [Bacteroidota bacterium]|nr:glycosyltransferase family 2 protein [Bacteroidota bacterium]
MSKTPTFSFVIPAYNEQENIPLLYKLLCNLDFEDSESFEVLFINDGSEDDTEQTVKQLSIQDDRVKLINLSRNFGHQAALSAGLKYARGKAVITMDCDLQDPPEVAVQMINMWKNGTDIVYARRNNFRKDNFIKRAGSKIYYRLMKRFAGIDIPTNVGDFRLVDKKVLDELNRMGEHSRYLRGMVAWTGFSHDFVNYDRPDRRLGISGYSFSKLATLGMDGMVNFSVLPLRLGFILGFVSIISGMGLFFYQLLDVIFNDVYYHLYKWLIVIVYIFMGFMFLLLWIIGEYIGKIYDETRNRPIYIVKETVNLDEFSLKSYKVESS